MCSGALVAIGKAVFEDDHISRSVASQLTETWKREKERDLGTQCIREVYTLNLYHLINQIHSNKFNKNT